jgi:formylmethanofuran dehydrogenase subunit A
VPFTYKGSKLVNAVQWAVGLELLLLINDPWRIFLTTDHPNGACFWRYPEIIELLMNADFRRECVQQLPAKALKRIVLADIDREYTLSEIAIITSAGPARALGMTRKGHLGVGADADVAIYNENPRDELMFRFPRYVLKRGEIVVEEGHIRKMIDGRSFVVNPSFDESIVDYLRPLFEDYYTMAFDNYPVEPHRVEGAEIFDLPHLPPLDGEAERPPRRG